MGELDLPLVVLARRKLEWINYSKWLLKLRASSPATRYSMSERSSKKEKAAHVVAPDPRIKLIGIGAPPNQPPLEEAPFNPAGFLYALPRVLLDNGVFSVLPNVNRERETQLADYCARQKSPGIFQQQIIRYDHLEAQAFAPIDGDRLNHSSEEAVAFNESIRPLARLTETSRGYAGWLITNRQFQQEQDDLITRWESVIRTNGFPGPLISATAIPKEYPVAADSNLVDFVHDYDALCIRWRLNGIVGPDLPVPMQPMLAGQISISVLGQLLQNGGIFYYPDTFSNR
jgi:hypothetical protein